MTPQEVMAHPKFGWSDYLQKHLWNSGVVVSKLHPIMGLRLAAMFVDLEARGLASPIVGQGTFQVFSGVRSRAKQVELYNDICLRQRRCEMVANPHTVHGVDAEGVQRSGSNHQAQAQDPRWGVEVGYAVDLTNGRQTEGMSSAQLDAAWKPLHDLLPIYGLTYPLNGKGGLPLERWHIEWFPRRAPAPLTGPIAWPDRPGVHRPLMRGMVGGDVAVLQRMSGVKDDGVFGPGTEVAVKALRAKTRPTFATQSVTWDEADQAAYESAVTAPAPAPAPSPAPVPAGDPADARAYLERSIRNQRTGLSESMAALDALG